MLSASTGYPINNGPTMMLSSIKSNTEIPDSGISSTDSTGQSVPPSAALVQSTEVRCCLSCYLVHIFLLLSVV